ncbi:Outer membrane porin [Pseudomonas syringae pv. syringae]|nr:Outer membrane porin [Pseudomonas syringae pv. syringae]
MYKKISIVAFTVGIGAMQQSFADEQSDAVGFIDGAKFTVKTRNMYMNRDNRASNATRSYGEEWAQGFVGVLESGFT